jgi:hypothetical protein
LRGLGFIRLKNTAVHTVRNMEETYNIWEREREQDDTVAYVRS